MPATLKTLFSGAVASVYKIVVSGSPTGGFLVLNVASVSTATSGGSALAFNATASAVQTALQALSTVGAGNATVTGAGTAASPYVVTFSGTALDANGVSPRLTATANYLTGGTPAVAVNGSDVDVVTVAALTTVKVATGTLCNISGDVLTVGAGITPSGQTSGPQFKSVHNKTLSSNESMSLSAFFAGDMLGPGDKISVYSSIPGGVSAKFTGAVLS